MAADAGARRRHRPSAAVAGARGRRARESRRRPRCAAGRPLPSISADRGAGADRVARPRRVVVVGAHAGGLAGRRGTPIAAQALSAEMQAIPERNISRLVCPRRLTPRTDYVACVVPATDGGRLRGLGQPVARRHTRARLVAGGADRHRAAGLLLTGSSRPGRSATSKRSRGACARRRSTAATRRCSQQLRAHRRAAGVRSTAITCCSTAPTPGQTVFEGAMVSLDFTPARCQRDVYADKLADDAQQRRDDAWPTARTPPRHVPTLAPPIYGEYPGQAPHGRRRPR